MTQDLWKNNKVQQPPQQQQQRTTTLAAPLTVPGASSAGSIRVVSGSGFRYVVPFPYRLHEMLSSVTHDDSSIVSWLPDGKHFKVHDPRRFVETVIPSAFKQKSLKSFQRQLHLYGFQRVHEGVDKGALRWYSIEQNRIDVLCCDVLLPRSGRFGTRILLTYMGIFFSLLFPSFLRRFLPSFLRNFRCLLPRKVSSR